MAIRNSTWTSQSPNRFLGDEVRQAALLAIEPDRAAVLRLHRFQAGVLLGIELHFVGDDPGRVVASSTRRASSGRSSPLRGGRRAFAVRRAAMAKEPTRTARTATEQNPHDDISDSVISLPGSGMGHYHQPASINKEPFFSNTGGFSMSLSTRLWPPRLSCSSASGERNGRRVLGLLRLLHRRQERKQRIYRSKFDNATGKLSEAELAAEMEQPVVRRRFTRMGSSSTRSARGWQGGRAGGGVRARCEDRASSRN